MKKVFKLSELDCASCAAKMEKAIRNIPGVLSVTVNFMTQKLTLEAEDAQWDRIAAEAQSAITKIEPSCTIAG
ncbi:MAG: cation transporter [Candidatus Limiplasma sp.]|nr:cation transporter [Candidatus Limiplasma sp.]